MLDIVRVYYSYKSSSTELYVFQKQHLLFAIYMLECTATNHGQVIANHGFNIFSSSCQKNNYLNTKRHVS